MVFITFLCRYYYYLDHENEHWYYTSQFFQDTFWYQYSHYTIVTNRHIIIILEIKCLFSRRTNITLIYQITTPMLLNFLYSQSTVMSFLNRILYNETTFYRPTLFHFALNTPAIVCTSILALLIYTLRLFHSCAHVQISNGNWNIPLLHRDQMPNYYCCHYYVHLSQTVIKKVREHSDIIVHVIDLMNTIRLFIETHVLKVILLLSCWYLPNLRTQLNNDIYLRIIQIFYFILSLSRTFTNLPTYILMTSIAEWLYKLLIITFTDSVCYIICMACVYDYYTYVCINYLDTTNVLCIEPADGWYMYLTWQLVAWNVSWNEYYSKCLHFICLSIKYNFARDSTIHNARNGHFQQNSMYYFSRMVINYVDRITKLHLYFYTCIVCYPATLLPPCTVPLLLTSNLTIYDGS